MKNGTIWIDLTDLNDWSGHFTGIQRVVYQIAERYGTQDNVAYFTFNSKDNTFRVFDFSIIRNQITQREKQREVSDLEEHELKVTLNDHVKSVALRAYHKSPQAFKDYLTPVRKHKLKKYYRDKKRLIKKYKSPKSYIDSKQAVVHFNSSDTVLVLGKPWDYPGFINTIRKEKIDKKFKLVHLIYDMIPVFHPNLFGIELFTPYTRHVFEAISTADGIIAISESTKRDISRFCKELIIPEPPIKVIRLGDELSTSKSKKPKLNVEKNNFIMCVATIEVRKNHQLLYATYKEGLAQGLELPKLVIVGTLGWYAGDVLYQLTHDPDLKNLVYVSNEITDDNLHWLYGNCKYTIFPSIYEGWGLPVAESLAHGKFCIASNTSSMPEIAGDLIDYFSPYNTQQCLDAIVKYLDPKLLGLKEETIKNKYKTTSWGSTFMEVEGFVNKAQSK